MNLIFARLQDAESMVLVRQDTLGGRQPFQLQVNKRVYAIPDGQGLSVPSTLLVQKKKEKFVPTMVNV